jgi:rod shape-determining protein MreD
MIIILSFAIGLFLTSLRTVYLPSFGLFQYLFDPNISLIISAFLFGKKKDGYIIAVILGFMTDNLSGGPFGIYLLSYIWTIIITQIISLYLQKESLLIIWASTSACIIIQNSSVYFMQEGLFFAEIFTALLKQIAIGLLLSPLLILLIKQVVRRLTGLNRKLGKISSEY